MSLRELWRRIRLAWRVALEALRTGEVVLLAHGQVDAHTHQIVFTLPSGERGVECYTNGGEVGRRVAQLRALGLTWDYIYDGVRRDWGPR
jgi:hypothetical protein